MALSSNTNTLPKDLVVHSFYIGGLDKTDLNKIKIIKEILDKKLALGNNIVDINKLADYCNKTELQARQYITYLEYTFYHTRTFIITNGAKEFQKIDSLRAAAIQERSASKNQ